MDPERRQQLEEHYLATDYVVPDLDVIIKIGEPSLELDVSLLQHQKYSWAFVTACNPGSEVKNEIINAGRQLALEQVLKEQGHPYWPGEGRPPEGSTWVAEPSFLVMGIGQEQALELARQFGQNALVFGRIGEPAELVWTPLAASEPEA